VPNCASCGRSSEGDFRFCPYCAAPLAAGAPPREQRKTVTVLFCDVIDSTALGESMDPEALRALLARYFGRMKGIVDSHGGIVEKFIGDAIMAVFGVPVVHEDDAVRACRAAVEMRRAFPELGINGRIGVTTGEVVTGTVERLATGDAVNVSARLQQAAAPGEVLVGAETLALARHAVAAEPVEPLALKGKSEPVPAFRLISAHSDSGRRFTTPMVGREAELRELRQAFTQSVHNRSCRLFTVLGAAGVGKSRLAAEFLNGIEARVVRGRCLSYGEGITYWPVVEIVKQLKTLADSEAAMPLRSLLGEAESASSADEIAWGFRKLLEQEAQERPVVCVLDDLHWAEPTLLDLVEHVAALSRDAPVVLLCMARTELLDKRPDWGETASNSSTVLLEPLDAAETEQLLKELGGVAPGLRDRIADAAEGNPLFLEEILALVRDSGDGEISVPPTIQAVLAARLDQLDPAERAILERGAVEGRVFHQTAVQALGCGEPQEPHLAALVRKQLLHPDTPQFAGAAYRFRHQLTRDAAYDALPKSTRADLHARYADWLEEQAPDLVELDEILGHHLERAARYKAELVQPDASLAERAAQRLTSAGRRALGRGDDPAARSLLERSLALTRPLRLDVHVEVDLAEAVRSEPRQAAAITEHAAELAAVAGDSAGEALARAVWARHRFEAAPEAIDDLDVLARAALPLLEQRGDHAGLVYVWNSISEVANHRGHWGERGESLKQAIHNVRLATQQPASPWSGAGALSPAPVEELVRKLGGAYLLGPEPADELLQQFDRLLPGGSHPGRLLNRARLLAMLDRHAEAWPVALDASDRLRDLTGGGDGGEHCLAEIATLAGDHNTAVRYSRIYCDRLEAHHQYANLSTWAPTLGRSLCALGRYEESELLAEQGRALGDQQDATTQALWRQVKALVLAHRGQHAEAESLAREAVAIIEETDGLNLQGDALCDLAEVLSDGSSNEAAAVLEQALERYERKRNLAMVRRVREQLELQPA
jgi:class 3 adenylate cyclase